MSPANIFFSQDVKPNIQNSEKPKISPKPIIRDASTESEVFEELKSNGIVPPYTEKQPQMDPLRLIYINENILNIFRFKSAKNNDHDHNY